MLEDFSTKMTFVFSNVPGPRFPFVTTGKPSKGIAFFVPGLMTMAGGISIISHYDSITIGLFMDNNTMKDPKVLMDIIYDNLD